MGAATQSHVPCCVRSAAATAFSVRPRCRAHDRYKQAQKYTIIIRTTMIAIAHIARRIADDFKTSSTIELAGTPSDRRAA